MLPFFYWAAFFFHFFIFKESLQQSKSCCIVKNSSLCNKKDLSNLSERSNGHKKCGREDLNLHEIAPTRT